MRPLGQPKVSNSYSRVILWKLWSSKIRTLYGSPTCTTSPIRSIQFSVPQIEYPLVGSSKKGSHVYFLLQVLLFDINVVPMEPWWPDVTIVQSDVTIVVPWQLSTGSKHGYLFSTAPLWVFYLRYWELLIYSQ